VTSANIERVRKFFAKVPAVQNMVLETPPEARTDAVEVEDQAPVQLPDVAVEPDEQVVFPEVTDDGLLGDFIEEAGEHLDEIEHNLLLLERQPDSVEVLNDLFRSVHTIKGSAEYLGLLRIAELSHKLESLLDLLRQQKLNADLEIIDTLIKGHDRIAQLVKEISDTQKEQSTIGDLAARIEALVTPKPIEERFDEPSKADAFDNVATPAHYEESYDKELFAIFVSQLKEGLKELAQVTERLKRGADIDGALARGKEWLSRLKSSANYMEYDELKAIFDQWIAAVDALRNGIEAGTDEDIDAWCRIVMAGNAIRVRQLFDLPEEPIVSDVSEGAVSVAPEPSLSDLETNASVGSIPIEDPLVPVDDLATPIEIDADEIDAESDIQDNGASVLLETYENDIIEDQSLLARLESAFDARFEEHVNTDFTVDSQLDVVKELFSDETPESESSDIHPIGSKDVHASPETAGRVGTDTVEAFLFSDTSTLQPSRSPSPPLPLASKVSPAEQRLETVAESEDHRSPSIMGRRQTDKFRERHFKQSIRVDAGKIDTLMNQVGELVVTRAGFNQLFLEMRELQLIFKQAQKLDSRENQLIKDLTNRINEATVSLGRVTSELQENVMKVRMLPIAQLFSRYPRVVYDLVRNTNKKVELDIKGEETELDRMVIEQISDPLLHIIRNAVDHGIEPKEERQRKGKNETGVLRLEAYHEGNYVVIEVSDDGRGIDAAKIKTKALNQGIVDPETAERMDDDDWVALITRPGFSTADEVTHTSGRGVGMDVVKDNIEKLNGTLEIEGRPGRGALFRIKIPLTLAIIQALMVRIGNELFTIPLSAVDETIRIRKSDISTIEGLEIYSLRETTLPLIRLAQLFKMQVRETVAEELFVVVVNTGTRQVGLVVDQLKGREEVVIKPLEDYLQEKSGFSGATILGDGSISLILDVSDLVYMAIDQHAKRVKAAAI